ncbi:MAG TPA: CBS domain-containing protein [Anaerolineales bacterium]|nr:CBS domain-containing protein [Anaerolineales bacterium]
MTQTIRGLMHKSLITCLPSTSLGQVAAILNEQQIHALVVAEEEGQPLGIISDFDLLAGEWLSVDEASLNTMRKLTARDLMSSPIETVDVATPVHEAAKRMAEKTIHRMLVTEMGKPVGIISISDFVAGIAEQEAIKRETVGDVMSDTFLVCREDNTVLSAARTMTQSGWRSILIVNSRGELQGLLTGHDLLPLAGTSVDESLRVSALMSRDLVTIDIHASLQQAADFMIQKHRHRVVVVDSSDPESFPLGVISSFDIVAAMARPGSIWQNSNSMSL